MALLTVWPIGSGLRSNLVYEALLILAVCAAAFGGCCAAGWVIVSWLDRIMR